MLSERPANTAARQPMAAAPNAAAIGVPLAQISHLASISRRVEMRREASGRYSTQGNREVLTALGDAYLAVLVFDQEHESDDPNEQAHVDCLTGALVDAVIGARKHLVGSGLITEAAARMAFWSARHLTHITRVAS